MIWLGAVYSQEAEDRTLKESILVTDITLLRFSWFPRDTKKFRKQSEPIGLH